MVESWDWLLPVPDAPTPEQIARVAAQYLAELESEGCRVVRHPDGTIEAHKPPAPGDDPGSSEEWFFENEREIYDRFVAEWEISRETDRARGNPPESSIPSDDDLPF